MIWTSPVVNEALGDYGRIPAITKACDEWSVEGVNLRHANPIAEARLSPLSFLLLWGYRKVSRFDHIEEPRALFEHHPYVMREVIMRLMMRDTDGLPIAARDVLEAEYMEGGACLFDVIKEAYRDLGVQIPLGNAALPVELRDSNTPITHEEYTRLKECHPEILDEFIRVSGLPENLRAIDAASVIIPQRAFEGVHAVCVQHVLATQIPMFIAMEEHGLDPTKVEIIGVPYSTNYVTQHALDSRGYRIHTPLVVDPNDVSRAVEDALIPALQRALERSNKDGGKILVLDDGGKATIAIHTHFQESAHRFHVVEQTSRGIREVIALESSNGLRTRVIDVAHAWLKSHEAPKVGGEILDQCASLMERINLSSRLEGAELAILGAGVIGLGVGREALGRGARVTFFDPALLVDDEVRASLEAEGFVVARSKPEALRDKALVVGCAGERTIEIADLEHMNHQTVVASASSRDVEIDLSVNRSSHITSVPLLAEGPGDTRFTTRVWRLPEKDIIVLRNGFPVNFNGRLETSTFESIELTRALMLMGSAQALAGHEPARVALSLRWQNELVEALGLDPHQIPNAVARDRFKR